MTDEEMIENLKCVIADLTEQGNKLQAENAELHKTVFDMAKFIYWKICEWHTRSDVANFHAPFWTELFVDHMRDERLLKKLIIEKGWASEKELQKVQDDVSEMIEKECEDDQRKSD